MNIRQSKQKRLDSSRFRSSTESKLGWSDYQASSIRHRASGTPYLLSCIFLTLMLLFSATGAIAAVSDEDAAAYKAVIDNLSALGDRSTGSPGNQKAADYIKARLSQLGFEVVDSQKFAVPVLRYGESTLSLPGRGMTVPIHPIESNAITPQTIVSPGVSGPLIYVGSGELHELDGKTIEDAIILMEFESGKNWQYTANLGAKALIYVDRGNTPQNFL